MSGQLVGEVIAAAGELRANGLSQRGFHALVAIAEKCDTFSRRGSVRWDHIRAGLYGASMSTAKRAVADLQAAGVIRLVKRGFNNHAGRVCAPVYEIERLTQVSQSPSAPTVHSGDPIAPTERITQPTQSLGGERVKPGGRTGQIGGRTVHSGDLLDVPLDVPPDGRAREPVTQTPEVLTPGEGSSIEPSAAAICDRCRGPITDSRLIGTGWCAECAKPLPVRCPRHKHLSFVEKPCGDCARASRDAKSHAREWTERRGRAADMRRAAIAACGHCDDEHGHRLGPDGSTLDPVVICDHSPPQRGRLTLVGGAA